jgi:molybdopterin/thiamine biosynthesis adenylyltransferase
MDDQALLRYSRHILLDEIGIEGQERISRSHVLVVGAGGLGAPAAMYLAAAGVGHLTVADPDTVDLTNLQRQIIHSSQSVGQPKVASAADHLAGINPLCNVHAVQARVDSEWLQQALPSIDVVLDCSDNFETRHVVNAACVTHGVPLVSGAAIRFDGQISVFDHRVQQSGCYACVFPLDDAPPATRCSTMGVFAPLVGIIGAMQAAEALKLLLQLPGTLRGRLLLLDALSMEWNEMKLQANPSCHICGSAQLGK